MSEKTNFDVLNGKLDKILLLLEKKPEPKEIVSEHVSGVNLEDNTENFSVKIEYQGRTYEKFKPCKFKCGGLTAWAKDYKQGDKMLHIHPTDHEILGFSQKGLDDQWHCPVVLKK